MASPNQVGYQDRLDFIHGEILTKHLGLSDDTAKRTIVSPIHYDPNFQFKYNNFVYHIKVADASPALSQQQPGCVPIPSGTSDFVLRLGNREAEGMHGTTRVENEVAIMSMASAALRHIKPHVVPRVFAWGSSAADSQGWILQERMSGVSGDEAMDKMDPSQKREVGWRADGVRERLEAFLETGISAQFASLASREERVIAHGDLYTNNILVDPSSARITALLDYDFSSIQHPCYDFLRSIDPDWGQMPEWIKDQPDEDGSVALRRAKLNGTFPSPLPANTEAIQWDLAAAWEHELEKLDAKRPSTIVGMENIANVDSLLSAVLPFQLSNPDFLHGKEQAEVDQMRRYFGRKLVALMEHMGL
ncbi:hypothetical protein MAPG_06127 [Magnaporthiopsis poae ATCC 64411]|uniref:Aminoglycoside phosphotransferase domain-containing protein n=1 Tax=Magnaporthiopsis poae (strain ATCC 64411 / 73-15) TaxID=644358 RepID=A0A0C4E176_MAGP6|nr:hypothetical protein MAPG_06127 [Magnaporthiopsis poae ATCC 64411]